jgi:hypothetical protein
MTSSLRTDKTSAIRTLAREWKKWCSVQYVIDPERLFLYPSYLTDVVTTYRNDDRWRLIVAEDSDEYLRATARKEAGESLGRLLNVSDGILSEASRNTLVLLTTNERLNKLHPALIRPGRCLAQVEFTRFTVEEARNWLSRNTAGDKPLTLAELVERRRDMKQITNDYDPDADATGMYL